MNLQKIKAVGFDLDGTLYPSPDGVSEWIRGKLLQVVSEKMGWDVEKTRVEYGRKLDEIGSNTKTLGEYGLDGKKVFEQMWEEFPIEEFVERDEKLLTSLQELGKKYLVFLISNGGGGQILKKLQHLGIESEWFDPLIACYDHEGWIKPNPEPFLYVLDEIQLRPEEVLYVGDRVTTDIEGARGVGMKTMLVYGESDLADLSVRTIEEGLEMLLR